MRFNGSIIALIGSLHVACGDDAAGPGGGEGSTASAGPTTGASSTSTASTGSASSSSGAPPDCVDARDLALVPIDQVSEGAVTILEEENGVATLFVDASAGGISEQATNPWIYVDFAARARVDLTDPSADTDATWDIAIKRPILRSNSGDGGYAGAGGAIRLDKPFEDVTAVDASATFQTEVWFDADCNLFTDATGAIATAFDGWYDYENAVVTPGAGTWLVRGGDGTSVFKLEILDYYANPDGSHGMAGGRYTMRIAEVTP